MADPIRMSALGRDAQVGDLYNFFTDVISPRLIDMPNERKEIRVAVENPTLLFFYKQPEKFKHHILGINSHLVQSMTEGSVPGHQLWFADYLNTNLMDGDEQHAQVTLSFRVIRRTEILDPDFLVSNTEAYRRRIENTGATHVIEKVIYGAEVICSIRKALDLPRENKKSTEFSIYLAANKYLNEIITKSFSAGLPVELASVSCKFLDSLTPGEMYDGSFDTLIGHLQSVLWPSTGNIQQKWKPIQFLLRNIPIARIEDRQLSDTKADIALEKERHGVTKKWMEKEISVILNDPSLRRFPQLKKFLSDSFRLLLIFWEKIEENYKFNETLTPNKILEKTHLISDWLNNITDWFGYRRKEIEEIGWLLGNTDMALLDLVEIEAQMKAKNCKTAKLFVLKVEYKEDLLVKDIQKLVRPESQDASIALLPVLPTFSDEKQRLKSVSAALREFANEAKNATSVSAYGTSYHIVLDRFTSENETIKTVDYSGTSPIVVSCDNLTVHLKKKQNYQPSLDSNVSTSSLPHSLMTPTVSHQNQLLGMSKDAERVYSNTSSTEKPPAELLRETSMDSDEHLTDVDTSDSDGSQDMTGFTKKKSPIVMTNVKEQWTYSMAAHPQKDFNGGKIETHQSTVPKPSSISEPGRIKEAIQDQNSIRKGHDNSQTYENRRVAEIYADSQYSTLIKKGSPNVYLLNATETSNSDNTKWFNIYRPGGSSVPANPRQHKIIILMGGTGSGKSTLINGMVNYILGVKWNDPFRFKCVREDENVKNQAHSQTSSVTAYTLHHQDGMTIPYSITIIDTPGYGDTRGMKRDKEITANIHRFLTQQETRIDELHAVCFVAASGDSRLTATQRYIIDSVLAIFGKDMKENLRLLVTFADNAVPPVVGACRDSNFPVTSTSDGIRYSKFNSSVLYCSNVLQSEEECGFDQLFWDMGEENFQKFFAVLKGMEGCDLKSTREVVRSRDHLEQSLIDIEQEMEVCLTHIENIEILQRKIQMFGHNTGAMIVEQISLRNSKSICPEGLLAYNCLRCNTTCARGIPDGSSSQKAKKRCTSKDCECQPSEHKMEPWEWRLVRKTVSVTLSDAKAKYEKDLRQTITGKQLLEIWSGELQVVRAKVLSLVDQVTESVKLLESAALKSNVLSTSDYLSFMRSRVLEEQKPGYVTRLQTLDELQHMLAGGTSQQGANTAARQNREPTFPQPYSDGASGSSTVNSYYNQPSSRNQTTLATPPNDDHTQTKTGYLKYIPKIWKGK